MSVSSTRDYQTPTYRLQPEQVLEVTHLAKEQGGLRTRDIEAFKQRYNAASKPIHLILENLGLPVIGATSVPSRSRKAKKPTPQTHHSEDDIFHLKARLEREIEAARKARAEAEDEKGAARKMMAEARKAIKQTADLRKKTADERRSVADLVEERDALLERIDAIEHLDPNTPAFVRDLSSLLGNGIRADKRLKTSNRILDQAREIRELKAKLEAASTMAAPASDDPAIQAKLRKQEVAVKRLRAALTRLDGMKLPYNMPSLQHLPKAMIEPLYMALFAEIQRRENGGRQLRGAEA